MLLPLLKSDFRLSDCLHFYRRVLTWHETDPYVLVPANALERELTLRQAMRVCVKQKFVPQLLTPVEKGGEAQRAEDLEKTLVRMRQAGKCGRACDNAGIELGRGCVAHKCVYFFFKTAS